MKKQSKSIPKPEESLDENKGKETPNQKQERFCQLYAGDREFFGNGVESYLEVYDVDKHKANWYKTACACASRLLSNAKVYNRINEILAEQGLNDQFVDKQLLFLISQHDDKGSKVAAIREYNKLKARIVEKSEVVTKQVVGFEFVVPEKPITE